MTTFNLTTATAGLKWQAEPTKNQASVFVKNAVTAYVLTASAATEVTDLHYPAKHTYSVTSLTSVTTTATVTVADTTGLTNGDSVVIAGASPAAYNGTFTIAGLTATTFTYTFAGGTSPATGTITAVGGKSTVPGAVFLDDRMYVQMTTGEIVGSDDGDVTSWQALNTISPQKEPSNAVAIAKSLNYLVAFKQWDIEFFWDAKVAAPASVLATSDSSYIKLGAATADAIVEFDGGIVFMSKRDNSQRSREIHVLNGLAPRKISSAEVERILNGDTLATVYSMYLSTAGHQFYVLTLVASTITIVYDFNIGLWYQWSILAAQSPLTLTSLTSSGGVATATKAGHGYADGDPVAIAGADQADYNGTFNVTFVSSSVFTFPVATTAVTPATGTITSTGYNESYFPGVAYAQFNNLDLILHETSGKIFSLEIGTFQDDGLPMNVIMRTAPWDAGSQHWKFVRVAALIGDRASSSAILRYSDDDYATYSTYKPLDLSVERAKLTRLGRTVKRAWEVRHTANTALRLEEIEIEADKGN